MTYQEYIRSDKWTAMKAKYRASKLCRNKCFVCALPGRWDIHHRTYKRLAREWLQDFIELCPICHHATHQFHEQMKDDRKGLWKRHRKLRTAWKKHVRQSRFKTNDRHRYIHEVAWFFDVDLEHPFVSRVFN